MRFDLPDLPAGWPWSLWFFAATIVVYLLQRFPITGIFLMIVGAAFWSVILINLGIVGIGLEALVGRVSRLWLIVPLAYFGGYYLLFAKDQATLAALRAAYARDNAGQSLPFDPARQDLLLEKGEGDSHPGAFEFVQHFGLKRVFESSGRVHFMGNSAACALLRSKDIYRSAGVYSFGFFGEGKVGKRRMVGAYCSIYAPGEPDKPVLRVISNEVKSKSGMGVRTQTLRLRDEASGRAIEVKTGTASPLKRFPMLAMGCGLNSGAPSWDCFIGFLRDGFTPLTPDNPSGNAIVAKALGLQRSDDYAAIATGPDALRAIGDAADANLVAKEIAILKRMLADPTVYQKDGWFRHLTNRPDVVAPYATRIFAALRTLQSADATISETGRNLWALAAKLPEEALAPYRRELVEWLRPENARPWTTSENSIYERLDVSQPAQREIVLQRLEAKKGDLLTGLLPPFCRMGAEAPADVKQRLLALWRARGTIATERKADRPSDHVMLYLVLARMGLKEAAGKVEQRYYGPTFAAIWDQVTPETPADICADSLNDLTNRFRRR
ncbi:MAG: hypothetical protein ABIW03_07175, partial [Sphingomicrobium sp.]